MDNTMQIKTYDELDVMQQSNIHTFLQLVQLSITHSFQLTRVLPKYNITFNDSGVVGKIEFMVTHPDNQPPSTHITDSFKWYAPLNDAFITRELALVHETIQESFLNYKTAQEIMNSESDDVKPYNWITPDTPSFPDTVQDVVQQIQNSDCGAVQIYQRADGDYNVVSFDTKMNHMYTFTGFSFDQYKALKYHIRFGKHRKIKHTETTDGTDSKPLHVYTFE